MLTRLPTLTLVLTLALYALPGVYAHMAADDYCYAAQAKEQGIWGATVWYYDAWSGRWAASALLGATLRPTLVRVIPVLLIVSVTCGAYLITRRWLIASAFMLGVVTFLPNLYQQMFWAAGALSYFPPLIMGLFLAALGYSLRRAFTKPMPPSNA